VFLCSPHIPTNKQNA
jgi:hypothetical protein